MPRELPPTMKAAVVMALIGILLLGMLLVVIVLLGGHWVRRLGSHRRGPAVPEDFVLPSNDPGTSDSGEHSSHSQSSSADTVRVDDTFTP